MKNIFLLLLSFIIINGFNSQQVAEAQEDETGKVETGKTPEKPQGETGTVEAEEVQDEKGTTEAWLDEVTGKIKESLGDAKTFETREDPFDDFQSAERVRVDTGWVQEQARWQNLSETLFKVISEWQVDKFTELYEEIQKLEEELQASSDPAKQEEISHELEAKRQELLFFSETTLHLMRDLVHRDYKLNSAIEKTESALNDLYEILASRRFILSKPDVYPHGLPNLLPPRRDFNPFDRDYDQLREQDSNRINVLEESRKRYRGQTCKEEDDRHHLCVEQCREIYSRRSKRDDCEKLPIAQIEVLAELHELLEDPDDDDLRDIDLADLEVYLNVSIEGFDSLIAKYSRNEARKVLFWIAENEKVANIVSGEDDNFKALEALFKEVVGSFSASSETHKPFIEKIDGSDRLMEIVIDTGNEAALEWFHEYITEKAKACREENNYEISLGCFTVFCKIGKDIDNDLRENWLSFEDFEEYIDDIVQAGVNGDANPGEHQWDTDLIDDPSDVSDFYTELCGNLAPDEN